MFTPTHLLARAEMRTLGTRSREALPKVFFVIVVAVCAVVLGACGEPRTVVVTNTETVTSTEKVTTTVEVTAGEPEPEESQPEESQPEEVGGTVAAPIPLPEGNSARELLNTLEIKGRAPKTGYERAKFGQRWSDDVEVEFGHNGCDTRNDILNRDLKNVTYKPRTRDCVVLTGTLEDPYSGEIIEFERGPESAKVQIDHVVPLADAWVKGAQQLSEQARRNFANDPRNLLAVDGRLNQQKGAGDAATWLPPAKGFRCEYVSRQVEVKAAYQLWVTQAEYEAIDRVLSGCGQ